MNRNGWGGRAAPNGYKILSIFLAAVLLIVAITELVLWQMDYIVFQNPNKTEEQAEEDVGSGMVVTPSGEGTFLSLNVSTLSEETAASENEEESDIKTLTVEFNPTIATDKRVTWSIGFANPSSAWASGKDVNDYVTLTPEENNGPSATLECKQAFGEQIIVTVTSMENSAATDTATVDYARRILDYRLWGYEGGLDTPDMLADFGESEILIDFAGVSFDDALSFQNGAWYQELLVTNSDGTPTYTEDELKDPLFPASDGVASQNAVFSDYTIKDNMIFFNDATDEELIVDVSGSFDMNEEVQDILSDYLLSMWQPSLPILTLEDIFKQGFKVIGSNLASVLFYDIDSTLQSYLRYHQDSFYSDFMTDLVAWLNANPDTPVWTINVVITGKYSTFEKTFTVRYDPSTVQIPVSSVSIDEESVVM